MQRFHPYLKFYAIFFFFYKLEYHLQLRVKNKLVMGVRKLYYKIVIIINQDLSQKHATEMFKYKRQICLYEKEGRK